MAMKKVLLFGKTGEGKSTLANMLVRGGLHDPLFRMGDGICGVTDECQANTGRGYCVVDTVGLGEETESERKNAEETIYRFLKDSRGQYSHILFVKSAGRFDELDKEIWMIFQKLFAGANQAFAVVVTKCDKPDKWLSENQETLREAYKECNNRFVCVNFPPLETEEPELEVLLEKKRKTSLEELENSLSRFFAENKHSYYHPTYTEMSDEDLRTMASNLWNYVVKVAEKLARDAGAFFASIFGFS